MPEHRHAGECIHTEVAGIIGVGWCVCGHAWSLGTRHVCACTACPARDRIRSVVLLTLEGDGQPFALLGSPQLTPLPTESIGVAFEETAEGTNVLMVRYVPTPEFPARQMYKGVQFHGIVSDETIAAATRRMATQVMDGPFTSTAAMEAADES